MDTIIEDFVIKSLKEESPFEDAFAENNDLPTFKEPLSPFRPLVLLILDFKGRKLFEIQFNYTCVTYKTNGKTFF